MKELIRKILKEEINNKKYDMLSFYKNSPKIDVEITKENLDLLDDFMWYLIDFVDYEEDYDYNRIHDFIENLVRYGFIKKSVAKYFSVWLSRKKNSLWDIFIDVDLPHVGGDDSFNDWLYHVISLGKDVYEKALNRDDKIMNLLYSLEPEESFNYAIPYFN